MYYQEQIQIIARLGKSLFQRQQSWWCSNLWVGVGDARAGQISGAATELEMFEKVFCTVFSC